MLACLLESSQRLVLSIRREAARSRPFERSNSGCQALDLPAPVEIDAVSAVGFEDLYHMGPFLFIRHINCQKEVAAAQFVFVLT